MSELLPTSPITEVEASQKAASSDFQNTLLEATIHGIATRQMQLQPDPQEQPTTPTSEANGEQRDPDRARTLGCLPKPVSSPTKAATRTKRMRPNWAMKTNKRSVGRWRV